MTELDALREEIDQLDESLVELLAQRFEVSRRVGELKRVSALPPRDEARERAQAERVRDLASEHGVSPNLAEAILRLIVDRVVAEHKEQ